MAKTKPYASSKKSKPTAAQRAAWKAEKQARGSDAPIEGRCGRKLGGTEPARYCKAWPAKGRRRCKAKGHGGDAKRGAESPAFVHGQRSSLYADVLGGALRRGYEAIKTDEELLSCREQIKLWTGRERQLVEQLSSEDGSMSECAVRETMGKVDEVAKMPAGTDAEKQKLAAALVQAWDAHRVAVQRLTADKEAWREVEVAGRMLVRFRREERRLMEARHLVMTVDKVLYLAALLTALAMKHIVDPAARARFCEDAKLLEAGHAVEIDAELIEGVWVGRRR
jgi:hypothetical protein